jgi:hypothetical protein
VRCWFFAGSGVDMAEKNDRWFCAASEISTRYYEAVAELNQHKDACYWNTHKGQLNRAIKEAVIAGQLRAIPRNADLFMPPSEEAFNLGMVNLQHFCDWTDSIGLGGCPKTAYELALIFKFEKAIEIANSISIPTHATQPIHAVARRFNASENHRRAVMEGIKSLGRTDGTRPSNLSEARALKARARVALVKGGFTENNFVIGWNLLAKDSGSI